MNKLPEVLEGIVPEIGSTWEWQPLLSHARELVRVTNVTWNETTKECWVESELLKRNVYHQPTGERVVNTLALWVRSAIQVETRDGDR